MKHILYINLILALSLLGCGIKPDAARDRGFDLYDLKKYSEAMPLLEKAFASGIDDPELVVRLAYCRATVSGDGLAAINILRDSALKYPKYARTYFELGFIASQFGPTDDKQNINQAIGFTRKALQLDTTDYKFRDNMGMLFFTLGEVDSAEFWFKEAKRLNPDDPELNSRVVQIGEIKARKAIEDSIAALDTARIVD